MYRLKIKSVVASIVLLVFTGLTAAAAPFDKGGPELPSPLCDRLQVAARRTGTCELAATGDGSSPIGRRSAIDRIAP